MILVFEMICLGTGHAATNSATIQTITHAFPDQGVRVFADISHIQELRSDAMLARQPNVSFIPVMVSPHYSLRPHIVSLRRGWRELWTILGGLRDVPTDEACLIMLISATPSAVFLASWLSWLMRRPIRVQVGLHGNLNDAFGWRTRNPLIRAVDLHAALTRRHDGRVRFLVLEDAIRRTLGRLAPAAMVTTDVLPHAVSPSEAVDAVPNELASPVRFGLVGQATVAKGITPFLMLAREFQQSHPRTVRFHLVGNAPPGTDMTTFAVLDEPVPTTHIARQDFLTKLQRLHYVCLLLRPEYYELSASGALMDAIIWLRPIIATPIPMITDLFDRFGDIGELCDDLDAVRVAMARLVDTPDPARYERQVANLRRLRASRLPQAQATDYQQIIAAGFPGLLSRDLAAC